METLVNSAEQVVKAHNNALAELFRIVNRLTDGGKKKIIFSGLKIYPNDINDWELIKELWIADYKELYVHCKGNYWEGDSAVRTLTTEQVLAIIDRMSDNDYQIN